MLSILQALQRYRVLRKTAVSLFLLICSLCCLLGGTRHLFAQAEFTAERRLSIPVGGGASLGNAGIPSGESVLYTKVNGWKLYGTFDPNPRWGLESSVQTFRGDDISERTFFIGPRYFRSFRRYTPYAKALLGRGTMAFPKGAGEISVPIIAIGGGLDYRASRNLQVRVDCEFQRWLGFSEKVTNFQGDLKPRTVFLGFSYLFR